MITKTKKISTRTSQDHTKFFPPATASISKAMGVNKLKLEKKIRGIFEERTNRVCSTYDEIPRVREGILQSKKIGSFRRRALRFPGIRSWARIGVGDARVEEGSRGRGKTGADYVAAADPRPLYESTPHGAELTARLAAGEARPRRRSGGGGGWQRRWAAAAAARDRSGGGGQPPGRMKSTREGVESSQPPENSWWDWRRRERERLLRARSAARGRRRWWDGQKKLLLFSCVLEFFFFFEVAYALVFIAWCVCVLWIGPWNFVVCLWGLEWTRWPSPLVWRQGRRLFEIFLVVLFMTFCWPFVWIWWENIDLGIR